MRALVLDTSTPAVSAALVDVVEGRATVLAERVVVDGRRHGELLAVGVQEVLRAGSPEWVVVGVGPGPFTGLRVGIMTAAAIADALGIPAVGACSLDGLAGPDVGVCSLDGLAGPDTGVVTDARRREVYWARYDAAGVRVDGPHVGAPSVAARALSGCRLVVGAGAHLYADAFTGLPLGELLHPSCAQLARAALADLAHLPTLPGLPTLPTLPGLPTLPTLPVINGTSRGAHHPGSPLPVPLITDGEGGLPLTPLYLRRPDAVATADR